MLPRHHHIGDEEGGDIDSFNINWNKPSGTPSVAGLYTSGGEIFAYDTAGNDTQLSPHDPKTGEWVFFSFNKKTGKMYKVNMQKLVELVERLSGEVIHEE